MLLAGGALSCLDTHVAFQCRSSEDCVDDGRIGVCEENHFCSFVDLTCDSLRRYGRYAGETVSDKCIFCGNGIVDSGEACDDGNQKNDDGCLKNCRWAGCGDTFVRTGVEECDDGNQVNNDGCNSACMKCDAGQASFTWDGNQHCYFRLNAATPWEEAKRACEKEGAHLVVYSSTEEVTDVATALTPEAASWIGLQGAPQNNIFNWVTGEPSPANLFGWSYPAPLPARPQNSCVTQKGLEPWPGIVCTTNVRALCEQAPWYIRQNERHAYRLFYQPLSFQKAKEACEDLGAHLISINDQNEQDSVSSQYYAEYWIGAYRDMDDGPTRWVTAEPMDYSGRLQEPDIRGPACLAMGKDRRWHERTCGSERPYACEKD
jgi:cysteine-rich repeat protein